MDTSTSSDSLDTDGLDYPEQIIVQSIQHIRPALTTEAIPEPAGGHQTNRPDQAGLTNQNIQTGTGRQACSVQRSDISEQAEQDRHIMKSEPGQVC